MLLLCALAHATTLSDTLSDELSQAMEVFSAQPEVPYDVAVTVRDVEHQQVRARSGVVSVSRSQRSRALDVDLRLGSTELDNTHPLRGFSAMESDGRRRLMVALDQGYALRHALRTELDRSYRQARERLVMLRANQVVKVEEENPAPDYTLLDAPVVDSVEVPPLVLDRPAWEALLSELSAQIEAQPLVTRAELWVEAERSQRTRIDTAGSTIISGRLHARVAIQLQAVAEDGDEVSVFRAADVHDPASLPSADTLRVWTDEATTRLLALRAAPRGEPYSGPVVLRGRAAGVFFHEVMGHRVEGHRQKDDDEGKTFTEQVGKHVLPDFIDVFDDPSLSEMVGVDLNGFYHYDDEGVAAQRAMLVDDGVFVGFLMGRSPIQGFPTSNGHGRRSSGNLPSSRMGNTIIQSSQMLSTSALREAMLREIRSQGLPYGYLVDAIDGGFTTTGRMMPNAFNVRASASWRVWADGRPDQLVRGIDLVGTPLVAFSNLLATGGEVEVFNGTCGAESGWVPVSAVAPSVLFRRLEIQLKEKAAERPPLLAKPVPTTGVKG